MLGAIYSELAKLIARDIYAAAKKVPDLSRSLKQTSLTKSGSGLPESVLRAFEKSFLSAMDHASLSDGYTKWRDGESEASFDFRLVAPIVDRVRTTDWAQEAGSTDDGSQQVNALGSKAGYNKLINSAVPQLVEHAIKTCCGRFRDTGDVGAWRVLTPASSVPVAKRGAHDFSPQTIYYVAWGTEKDTARQFKKAKKLIIGHWWRKPATPFEGPYLS